MATEPSSVDVNPFKIGSPAQPALAAYMVERYRVEGARNYHLTTCPDATAGAVDGEEGVYGCPCGCPSMGLQTVMSCPHGDSDNFIHIEVTTLALLLARSGVSPDGQ